MEHAFGIALYVDVSYDKKRVKKSIGDRPLTDGCSGKKAVLGSTYFNLLLIPLWSETKVQLKYGKYNLKVNKSFGMYHRFW